MATKQILSPEEDLIIPPSYNTGSRMFNYDLVYDERVKNLRCGFYKNKLKTTEDKYQKTYIIEAGFEHRLDLISYKFYGTARYDWVIADANNLADPIQDVVAGKMLIIPSENII